MSDIRGRIFGRVQAIDLYAWASEEPVATMRYTHWYLEVVKGDVVINEDNCADFAKLLADAEKRVIRYRNLAAAGVVLRPWRELVDEAGALL